MSETRKPPDRLCYRVRDAVEATGISRATLYRDIADGALKARKRGGCTVILSADLIAYLESFPEAAPDQ